MKLTKLGIQCYVTLKIKQFFQISHWQEVAVRTQCHLINSDPELLGRSVLSVTLPDRGQCCAVIRGSGC